MGRIHSAVFEISSLTLSQACAQNVSGASLIFRASSSFEDRKSMFGRRKAPPL
jgi:hypothetical protein